MADRVPICDLFSVNLIQLFHAPLCFHGLGCENFQKFPITPELKFIFLPLSADKCPRSSLTPSCGGAWPPRAAVRSWISIFHVSLPFDHAELPMQKRQCPAPPNNTSLSSFRSHSRSRGQFPSRYIWSHPPPVDSSPQNFSHIGPPSESPFHLKSLPKPPPQTPGGSRTTIFL